eukprot:15076689-Heterocapsa_arctica.AAC.1
MLSADGPDDWPEEWAGAEEGEELAAEEVDELMSTTKARPSRRLASAGIARPMAIGAAIQSAR